MLWYELEALRCGGLINAELDSIELKLGTIIELLEHCEGKLDVTIATLSWQKQVVRKFRQGS